MEQLLTHLVGDYILQSHDMALNKTKSNWWALYHGITYTSPFIFLTNDIVKLLIILITHCLIDRFRLAVYLVQLKNYLLGTFDKSIFSTSNGYPESTPIWLSTWLVIIADNTLHLVINYLTLRS